LADIVERVARAARRARGSSDVTIVAVSKAQPASAISAAFHAGQAHFGESYVQEAVDKMDELAGLAITWHFIGRVQANKTRTIAERFDWVHTVDREKTALRLSEQRPRTAPPLNVLIQVNLANEPQKGGVAAADVAALARAIRVLPRLALRGLMTLPPQQSSAAWFNDLKALHDRLAADGVELDTLSMGMSGDFELAIAAGSNCVRIGTAIFGPRRGTGIP
jgi:pyridoxal phosphate enzyme (YggS family)